MTQFQGSVPIGGIAVIADVDLESVYRGKINALKAELAALENKRVTIHVDMDRSAAAGGAGPNIRGTSNGDVSVGARHGFRTTATTATAQQSYSAATAANPNIPPQSRDVLRTILQNRPNLVGGMAAKYGMNPQAFMSYLNTGRIPPPPPPPAGGAAAAVPGGPGPGFPPVGAARRVAIPRAAAGGAAGGGAVSPPKPPKPPKPYRASRARRRARRLKRMGAGGSKMPQGVSRILSVYGAAHAAEAVMDFAKAAVQATRNLNAANTDGARVQAMLLQRAVADRAVEQIPIAGRLGVSIRNLFDTLSGNSQEDIARQDAQTQEQTEFQDQRFAMMQRRRQLGAQVQAQGFVAGGSIDANREVIEADRREALENLNKKRAAELAKYQDEDLPQRPETSQVAYTLNGTMLVNQPTEDEWNNRPEIKDAIARNKDRASHRAGINSDYDRQADLESKQFDVQQKRIDFELASSRMELDVRKSAAEQTERFQFSAAEATKRLGQFASELSRTPIELKRKFLETTLAEARADRSQMLASVGSRYAESFTPGADIAGDPLGIRDRNNPLDAIDRVIGPLETAANVMTKIFDNGPFRTGR